MAEALLKKLIAHRPDADRWHIESAGTWAEYGYSASKLSQYVMQEMGLDISSHQSRPVSLELIRKFDLILTMESQQKEGLMIEFEQYAYKIYMLSEMVDLLIDIPDPIGGDLEDYEETAGVLESMLTDGLDHIYRQVVANQSRR